MDETRIVVLLEGGFTDYFNDRPHDIYRVLNIPVTVTAKMIADLYHEFQDVHGLYGEAAREAFLHFLIDSKGYTEVPIEQVLLS